MAGKKAAGNVFFFVLLIVIVIIIFALVYSLDYAKILSFFLRQ